MSRKCVDLFKMNSFYTRSSSLQAGFAFQGLLKIYRYRKSPHVDLFSSFHTNLIQLNCCSARKLKWAIKYETFSCTYLLFRKPLEALLLYNVFVSNCNCLCVLCPDSCSHKIYGISVILVCPHYTALPLIFPITKFLLYVTLAAFPTM